MKRKTFSKKFTCNQMNSNSKNHYLIINLNDQTEFKIDNKTTKCKICEKNLLGIKIDKGQTFNMHVPD